MLRPGGGPGDPLTGEPAKAGGQFPEETLAQICSLPHGSGAPREVGKLGEGNGGLRAQPWRAPPKHLQIRTAQAAPVQEERGPAHSLTFAFWPLPESKQKGHCGGQGFGCTGKNGVWRPPPRRPPESSWGSGSGRAQSWAKVPVGGKTVFCSALLWGLEGGAPLKRKWSGEDGGRPQRQRTASSERADSRGLGGQRGVMVARRLTVARRPPEKRRSLWIR